MKFFTKARISIDYIIIMIILLALLVVLLIYMGVLREQATSLFGKALDFITGQ